jgi:chondroitin AC lyase
MKKTYILLFIVTFFYSHIFAQDKYSESLRQLHDNVIEYIISGASKNDLIKGYLISLKEDGSWADIDYSSKERGDWPPANHLRRTLEITKAYNIRNTEFYHQKWVSDKIHQAINFWFDNDYICPNWWYPEIGIPQILNPIMILMESELTENEKQRGIKILNRSKLGMTGQNKVWLAGNVLLKSLLIQDENAIRIAAEAIQDELIVTTNEGVQPDWSYHQHGPQLQFGNYGLSYISDMIKWISILRNTPYRFDENKVKILRNYLLEGQRWVTWKQRYDISACGRQLFPGSQVTKATSLSQNFIKMEKIDDTYAKLYSKANDYKNLSGNHHFWRSDFQVQRTPKYYFSIKMCSERVCGAESCNSENIQGYHMGDGVTFLYQTQEEYENIFPFWDWRKIPGITTHQMKTKLPILNCQGYHIQSRFVGGISNGENGIAVMDYNRDGLKARKSWFMFDDMIICLGAGICSYEHLPVTTTINQSFFKGKVAIEKVNKKTGEKSFEDKPSWILHDKVGYYFPDGGNWELETKQVEGSWNRVASRLSDKILKAPIFKLWLEHGINPQCESYQYVLIPHASINKMKRIKANFPFVIRNDTSRQEIIEKKQNIAGVVFYNAENSDILGGIEVDQPCLIMLKKVKKSIQFSVADPTQLLNEINITLEGKYNGINAITKENKTFLKVLLPKGNEAGKTITFFLKKI